MHAHILSRVLQQVACAPLFPKMVRFATRSSKQRAHTLPLYRYAWIWYAFGWPLPYEFLKIPIYYVALPIGFSIIYLIQWFVHFGKEKVFAKRYARKMAAREDTSDSA